MKRIQETAADGGQFPPMRSAKALAPMLSLSKAARRSRILIRTQWKLVCPMKVVGEEHQREHHDRSVTDGETSGQPDSRLNLDFRLPTSVPVRFSAPPKRVHAHRPRKPRSMKRLPTPPPAPPVQAPLLNRKGKPLGRGPKGKEKSAPKDWRAEKEKKSSKKKKVLARLSPPELNVWALPPDLRTTYDGLLVYARRANACGEDGDEEGYEKNARLFDKCLDFLGSDQIESAIARGQSTKWG